MDLVMTGYNKVNGVTMTEHGPLLARILKDEWGFRGVALSDWHAAHSTVPTALAGLDLAMPGPDGPWDGQLAAAVRAGQVSRDVVDDKVLRILRPGRRAAGSARSATPRPRRLPLPATGPRTAAHRTAGVRFSPIRRCCAGSPRRRSRCSATPAARCPWTRARSAALQ